jgi:type II secretory pathway pseudopilin PulG
MVMGPARNRGFTLVEVVLAVGLAMALLALAMGFHYRTADTRDALTAEMQAIEGERLVMDRLTDELRCAMAYPFLGIGLDGGTDHLAFVTPTLVGPRAWATWPASEASGEAPPPTHDLALLGYRLRAWEDEQGNVHVAGLERTVQPAQMTQPELTEEPAERMVMRDGEAAVLQEPPLVRCDLISSDIKFLMVRYYDEALAEGGVAESPWAGAWGGGDLPLAVEITLGRHPKPVEMELEDYLDVYDLSRRVIYLPGRAGSQAQGGRGSRAGDEGGDESVAEDGEEWDDWDDEEPD